jgi:hypothetical protein
MREACKNTPIEIINYNYARVVIDPDEARHFQESGSNIVQKFVEEVNGSAEGLKNRFGVVLTAKVSGKDKNVVLVEGVGRLFDASPEAFADISRLKSRIVASIEGINSVPIIATAADIMSTPPPASSAKPASPARKSPVKTDAAQSKPAMEGTTTKAPAKPIKKEKNPAKAPASPVEQDEKATFILDMIKAEQLLPKDDVIKRVQAKFRVDPTEATKIIDAFIASFIASSKGIECTDGFVFINKG